MDKKTIWFSEHEGYDCVPDNDFEKYERIIGFTKRKGNCDVSLRIQGFSSRNEDVSKRRYAFNCDINLPRGSRDWIPTLERMKEVIEHELEYSKKRKGKGYIAESTRRSCYKS